METLHHLLQSISIKDIFNGLIAACIFAGFKPAIIKLVFSFKFFKSKMQQKIQDIANSKTEEFKMYVESSRSFQFSLGMMLITFLGIVALMLAIYSPNIEFLLEEGEHISLFTNIFFILFIFSIGESIIRKELLFRGLSLREKNKKEDLRQNDNEKC